MTLLSCHLASSSGGGLVDKRDHFPFPSKFPILYSPLSRSIQTGQWIMYHHFSAASLFLYTPFFLDIEIPLLSSQLLLSHFLLFPCMAFPCFFSQLSFLKSWILHPFTLSSATKGWQTYIKVLFTLTHTFLRYWKELYNWLTVQFNKESWMCKSDISAFPFPQEHPPPPVSLLTLILSRFAWVIIARHVSAFYNHWW